MGLYIVRRYYYYRCVVRANSSEEAIRKAKARFLGDDDIFSYEMWDYWDNKEGEVQFVDDVAVVSHYED